MGVGGGGVGETKRVNLAQTKFPSFYLKGTGNVWTHPVHAQ